MTVAALDQRSFRARTWSGIVGLWGAFTGLLPHVLHHVGPLAGAALLAGAGGQALFAVIGFAASVPFLLRLHRRFCNWRAPMLALAVFAAMFAVSSLIIGPAISGGGTRTPPAVERPADHPSHHK